MPTTLVTTRKNKGRNNGKIDKKRREKREKKEKGNKNKNIVTKMHIRMISSDDLVLYPSLTCPSAVSSRKEDFFCNCYDDANLKDNPQKETYP